MKLLREAKPTAPFTSYFTINTAFLLLLEFFSLNQHWDHVRIFISAFCVAAAAILDRNNPNSNLITDDDDDISASPSLDHDRDTITDGENVFNYIEEHHEFKCKKNDEFDGDGESERCGYEGNDEDDGEDEDDGLSYKIEEFIAGRKRKWREEIIRERLLSL
ncbi:hypothetical protein AAHA92_20408 [Salvia divinorum]|uniref:Uncharacterized protein n=1 Tax=Salvia divinorum TaxID=28513 RepID=A0ABD1GH29_SALDI